MRVTDGPFAGFNGVVATLPNVPIGTLDESTRVGLLVEAFGRRSPIEFEFGQLESSNKVGRVFSAAFLGRVPRPRFSAAVLAAISTALLGHKVGRG